MIANPTELRVQRRNTAAFIAVDPETIVLTPREKTRTTTGGTVWTELPPREPQVFKIIPRSQTGAVSIDNRVGGGTMQEIEFTLLGNWDAQIGPHDIFRHDGAQWEVFEVDPSNGYEQRAQVVRFGQQGTAGR